MTEKQLCLVNKDLVRSLIEKSIEETLSGLVSDPEKTDEIFNSEIGQIFKGVQLSSVPENFDELANDGAVQMTKRVNDLVSEVISDMTVSSAIFDRQQYIDDPNFSDERHNLIKGFNLLTTFKASQAFKESAIAPLLLRAPSFISGHHMIDLLKQTQFDKTKLITLLNKEADGVDTQQSAYVFRKLIDNGYLKGYTDLIPLSSLNNSFSFSHESEFAENSLVATILSDNPKAHFLANTKSDYQVLLKLNNQEKLSSVLVTEADRLVLDKADFMDFLEKAKKSDKQDPSVQSVPQVLDPIFKASEKKDGTLSLINVRPDNANKPLLKRTLKMNKVQREVFGKYKTGDTIHFDRALLKKVDLDIPLIKNASLVKSLILVSQGFDSTFSFDPETSEATSNYGLDTRKFSRQLIVGKNPDVYHQLASVRIVGGVINLGQSSKDISDRLRSEIYFRLNDRHTVYLKEELVNHGIDPHITRLTDDAILTTFKNALDVDYEKVPNQDEPAH